MTGVVVAGAGQAAAQLAISLRQRGYSGPITLIGDEEHLPYERPPLSKEYLAGDLAEESLQLRPATFWLDRGVDVRTGVAVTAIDRARRSVELSDGRCLSYRHLVLATGAEPRRLDFPGATLAGVHMLRTRNDARAIRAVLRTPCDVVVSGAGFVGLEAAAVACRLGNRVTVVERLERAMGRVVTRFTADHVVDQHRRHGTDFRFGDAVVSAVPDPQGRLAAVRTASGAELRCRLLLVGAGVSPRTALAEAAGLPVDDGILVDERLRTADPAISAIGDCARFPSPFADGWRVRLESVQNAVDQARYVADGIVGAGGVYAAVPWFWTVQHGLRLQIAGLVQGHDMAVTRGSVADGAFSVFCFAGGRLVGVESVDRPADHMVARGLLAGEHDVTPEIAADPAVDLKAYRPRPSHTGDRASQNSAPRHAV
ncbi:NAD(P)/FAD-dependent oxidoreductase [Phytoactinopolyspora halotolerans]|uniref:FAD-dependent oxidoreductase n=1 Tax=Phytoactinopolyspora halotolerans TaxID=1981512 RepID=A0A6L9S9G2_9ACTN|nr:FAD-dependent oxidoreductase [Phytoactinopolyspora halotolerans]NEE01264.1 FAD-dependent oxidoreductase [Phytoactinopolyspora halotolerans]